LLQEAKTVAVARIKNNCFIIYFILIFITYYI
jgi:hypothetical protein